MANKDLIFDPDGDVVLVLHEGEEEEVKFPMRVSSKHMILASKVFKAMLQHSFREGEALRSAGKVEIPLPDDNPQAFTILMNVVHGRGRRVPCHVSLDLLLAIAILVDKYQLHDAVDVYSGVWIVLLEHEMPVQKSSTLFPWILIAWVFQTETHFKILTKIAMQGLSGTYIKEHQTYKGVALPIPKRVLDAIQLAREREIEATIRVVRSFIKQYERPGYFCQEQDEAKDRRACDAMMLGLLIKECSDGKNSLLELEPPFENISFNRVCWIIRHMSLRSLCDAGRSTHVAHGIKRLILDSISTIEQGLEGLCLEWVEGHEIGR